MNTQTPATRSGGPRRIAEGYSVGAPTTTRSGEEADAEPYLHIFNFEDESGFAIMSGDERVPSMLALTDGGSLYAGSEVDNPGLAIFLSRLPAYYNERIALADSLQNAAADSLRRPTTRGRYPDEFENDDPRVVYETIYGQWIVNEQIAPSATGYCQVRWGQGDYFNDYCPLFNGEETSAGCVPVAVAQLMTMYKYPAGYGDYSFNWDKMISWSTPDEFNLITKDHTARLIQQLGLPNNLNVAYQPGGSGAFSVNITRTLHNFGYACNPLKNYNTADVVQELRAGYPCLMAGDDGDSGHQWLVHGLLTRIRTVTGYVTDPNGRRETGSGTETEHYLRCNLGWYGGSDGYYLAGVFDTNASRPNLTRSIIDRYYRYNLVMTGGIRKK